VLVSGRVQGVFYRATCAHLAREAGVGGFVRNLPDGRVEAAFEGPDEVVERLVRWCRTGPDLARVDDVEVVTETPVGDTTFRVTG
jgi:acylphosphatase